MSRTRGSTFNKGDYVSDWVTGPELEELFATLNGEQRSQTVAPSKADSPATAPREPEAQDGKAIKGKKPGPGACLVASSQIDLPLYSPYQADTVLLFPREASCRVPCLLPPPASNSSTDHSNTCREGSQAAPSRVRGPGRSQGQAETRYLRRLAVGMGQKRHCKRSPEASHAQEEEGRRQEAPP